MGSPIELVPKGLRRRTVDATPHVASLFRSFARGGYSIPDAIAEYVDNSIEQIGARPGGLVNVDFSADGSKITTTIRDNGGGCREADALRFIQPANTGTTESSRGISRFGMGGKTAGLSIASQVRVYSKFPGENGFMVILDKQDLATKVDWRFEVYEIPHGVVIGSGETIVELRGMSTEAHAKRDSFRTRFSERYASLLRRPDAPILRVGGFPVAPRDPQEFILTGNEVPPGCVPSVATLEHEYDVRSETGPRPEKVASRIVIGLGPSGSTTPDKGARIYCNGRAVGGVSRLGMAAEEGSLPHTSDDLTWMRAVVEMAGPAELMPWTNRKDALDPSSPSYSDLEEDLRAAYTIFLEKAVAPAKERLRLERGKGSKTPRLSEVLEAHWRKQIEHGILNPKTIRPLLRDAPTFQKATRPLIQEEPPGPPSARDRGIVRLNAAVDIADVEKARELVASFYGLDEVENSEVVRLILKHFLECPVILQAPAEDKTDSS